VLGNNAYQWISTDRHGQEANVTMLDMIFVIATVLFFAAGILYVRGCARLR